MTAVVWQQKCDCRCEIYITLTWLPLSRIHVSQAKCFVLRWGSFALRRDELSIIGLRS